MTHSTHFKKKIILESEIFVEEEKFSNSLIYHWLTLQQLGIYTTGLNIVEDSLWMMCLYLTDFMSI